MSAMVGRAPTRKGWALSRFSAMAKAPSARPFRKAMTAGSPGSGARAYRKRLIPGGAVVEVTAVGMTDTTIAATKTGKKKK